MSRVRKVGSSDCQQFLPLAGHDTGQGAIVFYGPETSHAPGLRIAKLVEYLSPFLVNISGAVLDEEVPIVIPRVPTGVFQGSQASMSDCKGSHFYRLGRGFAAVVGGEGSQEAGFRTPRRLSAGLKGSVGMWTSLVRTSH